MDEVWRQVVDYPDYEVSSLGNVRRRTGGQGTKGIGRLLTWHTQTSNGYPNVRMCVGGVIKGVNVHKLVTRAFLGPLPAGMMTRHLDGNKMNNRIDNLRYGTAVENARDKVRHGTHRNGWSKVSPQDRIDIYLRRRGGEKAKDLALIYNVHTCHIYRIVKQEASNRRIDRATQ